MPSIRRYGPALVTPQVSPRPELGRGREQAFAVFQDILGSAQAFIRPAVEHVQTLRGEREALAAVQKRGPQWGLRQLQGSTSTIALTAARRGVEAPAPTARAADLIARMEQRGLPRHIAEAFALNFQDESGLNPGAVEAVPNVHGTRGFGLYQLTGPRRTAYERFAAGRGVNPSDVDAQLDWLMHELEGPERRAAQSIFAAETAGQAAAEIVTRFLRPAEQHRAARERRYLGTAGTRVEVPGTPEYELETLNRNTFEPRVPFTFRDAAFNRAADRIITARASSAMEEGMRAAMQRADGDVVQLRAEMDRVRSQVMGELPREMPGLAPELQAQFDRGRIVAERQAVELTQRRVLARQQAAIGQAVAGVRSEAERLALTGATAAELADHMAQATEALAQFGPRQAFEIAGQAYAADPSRAGILTADAIASNMAEIATGARRLMIQADFMRSDAPGQYAEEFRRQVFAGNSPLPAGQSLELLRAFEGQVRATESARRTEAERERRRLEQEMRETINPYVSMGAAGVPVAIPAEERARIVNALAPYPDLQRQAQMEFAVADAQVATHGMTGDELMGYVGRVREDMQAAVARGDLDLEGAAVIAGLQDRIRQIRDAITAETVGLPMINQLILNGGRADQVDYDALRRRAAGNQRVLDAINQTEAFHRDAEGLQGLNAAEREAVLEEARAALTVLAAQGQEYGAEALTTSRVVERLAEWSQHRREMAANDPTRFARSVGVELPSFEGAEDMGAVGAVITARVEALAPHTRPEGVDHPVPLTQAEIDQISEVFRASARGQQAAFLAAVAETGREQASAIFTRIGQADPVIYAAGEVHLMGNHQAAGVILRGAVDTRLAGAGPVDLATARTSSLGELFRADIVAGESVAALDAVATAYARGLAMAEGGRDITQGDLQAGYQIALGRQEDGTGGVHSSRYGATILPPGWRGAHGATVNREGQSWLPALFSNQPGRSLEAAINSINTENQAELIGGVILDEQERTMNPLRWRNTIRGLVPDPDDPYILTPLDDMDAPFIVRGEGGAVDILTIDLRRFQ